MSKAAVKSLELFPLSQSGPRLAQPIPDGLSRSKHRTAEKRQAIALGKHPGLGLPLHVLAPRFVASTDRKYPGEVRCGNCEHLQLTIGAYTGNRLHWCELATTQRPMRKWWPGCTQWTAAIDPPDRDQADPSPEAPAAGSAHPAAGTSAGP